MRLACREPPARVVLNDHRRVHLHASLQCTPLKEFRHRGQCVAPTHRMTERTRARFPLQLVQPLRLEHGRELTLHLAQLQPLAHTGLHPRRRCLAYLFRAASLVQRPLRYQGACPRLN